MSLLLQVFYPAGNVGDVIALGVFLGGLGLFATGIARFLEMYRRK